jgi:DnaJ-domain-containing protein 1
MNAAALLGFGMLASALVIFARAPLPPRRALGAALMVAAGGFALMRQMPVAGMLAATGLAFWNSVSGGRGRSRGTPGQTSHVNAEWLEMSLDHDTGAMDGRILRGALAGRHLSGLGAAELQALAQEIGRDGDSDSQALLQAYRERHREAEHGDEGHGVSEASETMSEEQAYRVLGLPPGADIEEIRAAYRRLIRKVHPDSGGTTALAAMINAAKDRLDPT